MMGAAVPIGSSRAAVLSGGQSPFRILQSLAAWSKCANAVSMWRPKTGWARMP